MTQVELDILKRIHEKWHDICRESATIHSHRIEVMAGILMRETHGGELLGPDLLGDGGHGHGLFQIDDRSFPEFCAGEAWKDPLKNAVFAGLVLARKRQYILTHGGALDVERASIAAYNCGEGNVVRSLEQNEDVDTHTTNHNYSRCVLEFAAAYGQILAEELPPPIAPTMPTEPMEIPKSGGVGPAIISFFRWFARVFTHKPGGSK